MFPLKFTKHKKSEIFHQIKKEIREKYTTKKKHKYIISVAYCAVYLK